MVRPVRSKMMWARQYQAAVIASGTIPAIHTRGSLNARQPRYCTRTATIAGPTKTAGSFSRQAMVSEIAPIHIQRTEFAAAEFSKSN